MKIANYLAVSNSEFPQFISRCIDQAFLNSTNIEKCGKVFLKVQLAENYRICDVDSIQRH